MSKSCNSWLTWLIVNCDASCCSDFIELQTKEQEDADRRGYEEGEEMRRQQEREMWLAGLEGVVQKMRRERRRRILRLFCCLCFL